MEKKSGRHRLLLSKELLERYYIEKGYSLRELADLFSCSKTTIRNRLIEYGMRCNVRKVHLPEEEVLYYYHTMDWTIHDIAEKYGVSRAKVLETLRKVNGYKETYKPHPLDTMALEAMKEDYTRRHISISALAQRYHVGCARVISLLRECGVNAKLRHIKELPMQEVAYLYEVEHLCVSDIAKRYEVSTLMVSQRLKEEGIKVRGHALPYSLEEIYACYEKMHGNIKRTAKALHCTVETVKNKLKKGHYILEKKDA